MSQARILRRTAVGLLRVGRAIRTRSASGGVMRLSVRAALGATAALATGILVAAGLAGGSYAFLNSRATTPVITITSGNLALTVKYGTGTAGTVAAIPTTAWATMLPGDVVGQQLTIASTGSASSTLTARLAATTAPFEIRIASGTCPATVISGAALTTTAAAAGTLAGGASSTVCVQATLPASAAASAAGASTAFSLILDSTQVPN